MSSTKLKSIPAFVAKMLVVHEDDVNKTGITKRARILLYVDELP